MDWHYHHHHNVPEGLGVFLVLWSSRWSWSLHLFLGRPMFLRAVGLYCNACFGSLFVSMFCTFVATFSGTVLFPLLCSVLPFFAQYIDSFLYLVLLFQVSVSKISFVLLLYVFPLFSSVPKLHFQISMLDWHLWRLFLFPFNEFRST